MALAMQLEGNNLWKRVDVEPSGTPFNSLIQLENENGIPRNPLINAGAIVVADVLVSHLDHPKEDFLNYVRQLSGHQMIHFDLKVAQSEAETGFRNAALANFLKSYGNLQNDVDTVLDFYFHQCSIAMNCHELVDTFMVFANGGCLLDQSECFFTLSQTKRINAIMQTCGFYDEAGEFTFRVGLPGKSGVGGGIVALHPQQYAVAVWSPPLNPKGNSAKGMAALELLTTKTGLSIF
jgi:glutaminase